MPPTSSKKSGNASLTKDKVDYVARNKMSTTKDKRVIDSCVSITSSKMSSVKNKQVVDSVTKDKRVFKESEAVQATPPPGVKCIKCAELTKFTRKIIGNILNITKHLGLQDTSRVVKTFLNLPNFLNTETQMEMAAHWLNDIQQDMDFLEVYAMKKARTSGKLERERLKRLERMYKMKMREVWQTVKGFQDVLERISPSLLLNLKTQSNHQDLIAEILNKSVANLKRNVHHYEQLISLKYEPKINALRKELENVTNSVTNTMQTLAKMEETYDAMKLSCEEHKNKYQLQVQIYEQLCSENDILCKEVKNLKRQLRNDTVNSHLKLIEEVKNQNETLTNSINQLNVKLKASLQMNFKVSKQLNEEKQMKESLMQLKDQLNRELGEERIKVKTLADMNAAFKSKLTSKSNIKEELSKRFDCDISDSDNDNRIDQSVFDQTDHKRENLERKKGRFQSTKHATPTKKTLESLKKDLPRKVTGNPCDDIKAEIFSNYKLIKQLEEEILNLNKLRMRIKEKNKSDMRPD
ncbi:hypothetical protein WDU94_002991 [Cyamophila willieti]